MAAIANTDSAEKTRHVSAVGPACVIRRRICPFEVFNAGTEPKSIFLSLSFCGSVLPMSDVVPVPEVRLQGGAPNLQPELESLLAQCYGDMRVLARRIMGGRARAAVFQPTELVNEVAIRLIRGRLQGVPQQAHFLALAARTMRQVLIDEARKTSAAKREKPMFMTIWPGAAQDGVVDLGSLDDALTALRALSPARSEIVELRFTLGMTVKETAAATGLSERTVNRQWLETRAWLLDYIQAHAET